MTDQNSDKALASSPNPADELREQLAALVPEAFSEGRLDLAALKRTLGESVVADGGERYALTWAGKSDAYKVLQTPSTATLRPERDKSVNFDDAQHVFVEGENLEVLKVLQKAYFGKIKLIYIDPPYNTGSDRFIYPDRFQESKEDYLRRINDLSDDGTLMREGFFRKNTKESGHYHSSWLSMMLPRLYIARNLLREDGFLVVSIDDNEVHNLRLLLDEIFGSENFVCNLIFDRNRKNDAKLFSVGHEYMLVYARSRQKLKDIDLVLRAPKEGVEEVRVEFERLKKLYDHQWDKVAEGLKEYYATFEDDDPRKPLARFTKVDERGPFRDDGDASWPGGGGPRYDVPHPVTGKPCKVPSRGWVWPTYERMQEEIDAENVVFGDDESTIPSVRRDLFSKDVQVMRSVQFSYAQKASQDLAALFGGKKVFENPKNYLDMARLVAYLTSPGDLVLDFFAGSGSTVHGVIAGNRESGTQRKIIAVQLPEPIEADTEAGRNAQQLGCATIADLARLRIDRSLAAEFDQRLPKEEGYKYFRLSPSNFKQWRGDGIETPDQLAEQMKLFVHAGKDGATVEDILYELLLKFGQEVTTPVEALEVAGTRVFAVHNRQMIFVLDGFTEAMILPLVEIKPREIVAIDGVFQDSDMLKTNLDLQCRDAGIRFTCL
ncbi:MULTISPECIES: site-specific DNA-methyltransferase [Burkholderia]|uniref:site-specific DNA-methyltransferase n=1 Tax=Burkholderia TaxID=32008 RepID=UPI000981F624|nr:MULTISPECIES: site-specific DNA-methyltransferase [Burkholderia]AQQ44096.1 site-specific DNA-methyltransferase [Burkholderia cenocepacia]MBG0881591.1 site-specific DNA-methyltransferase [Burkholderia sp. 9775_39]MBG0888178.1 site-specific DNA-methyltransferase [Burkholderia sp. 9773_38]ONV24629.1 site-specific DNA-methyltransferase [Burkholderia cenocepacia]ONV29596.1 site-specific DNA-methyltransferase [Burkholderia cenocepacia]